MNTTNTTMPPDAGYAEFGGLARDLPALLPRRRLLALIGGVGLAALAACGDDKGSSSSSSAASTTTAGSSASTASGPLDAIPDETGGPFPGDGSNGPNVLDQSGVVRRDITTSFGSMNGSAAGVPTTVTFTVLDAATASPLPGAAVYAWHCDQVGNYSLYSQGATDQNYLRGVQVADANGQVSFDTIFPGCYSGRWPHIHFEVYDTVDEATTAGQPRKTSQLAMPKATCEQVYAASGYEASVGNLAQVSLAADTVFRDDQAIHQIASITGDPSSRIVALLNVPV